MCVEFGYRESWWGIAFPWTSAVLAGGMGLHRLVWGLPYAPPLAEAISAGVLIGVAVFLAGLAFWVTADRLWRRRTIKVSKTTITAPRWRWSRSSVTIPFDEITRLDVWQGSDREGLRIEWTGGRLSVTPLLLPAKDDFRRLVALLMERLPSFDVPVNVREATASTRWFRPQFSLAWLLLLVTLVAVMLGLHKHVYGSFSWDALFDVGLALAIAIGLWLAWAAPRLARVLILGFLSGFWLELLAVYCWFALDWVRYPAGSPTPENWYPLTFALWQLAERLPEAVWVCEGPRASLLGGVLSGLTCGGGALAVWCLVKRVWAGAHPREGA